VGLAPSPRLQGGGQPLIAIVKAIVKAKAAIKARSTMASLAVAQEASVSLQTESAAVSGGLRIVSSLVSLIAPSLGGFAC
jgi:hypothetical protein